MHKPRGLLSSAHDERGRRSVVGLVDAGGERLWPAGRLDVESEGLMLLTNDGTWANRVLHPRYGVEREYAVLVDAAADAGDLEPPRERRRARRRARPAAGGRSPGAAAARCVASATERGRLARASGWARAASARCAACSRRSATSVDRLVRTRLGSLTLAGLRRASGGRCAPRSEVAAPGRRGRARMTPPAIAVDGPSGSGKSTVGHALAQRIGATFVDTGLMYRALTLAALERGIDLDDGAALGALAREVRIEVRAAAPRADRPPRDGACSTAATSRDEVRDAAHRSGRAARSAATPRCATRCSTSSARRRSAATR